MGVWKYQSPLLLFLVLWGAVQGHLLRRCVWFEEEDGQGDIGGVVPCTLEPGQGPWAECDNVTDLALDLREVPPAVRTLCLQLRAPWLGPGAFARLPELRWLQVGGVWGEQALMEAGAFEGLAELRGLHLRVSENKCRNITLSAGAFRGLHRLENLTLIGAHLALAPPALLAPLGRLRSLQLHSCCLRELGEAVCRLGGLGALEMLDLARNDISWVRGGGCAGGEGWPDVSGVNTLILTQNKVVQIEPGALAPFGNLTRLSLLFLADDPAQIGEAGLVGARRLELGGEIMGQTPSMSLTALCRLALRLSTHTLQVSHAQVQGLSVGAAGACAGLGELVLSYDLLAELDLGFWAPLEGLRALELWHCGLVNASLCQARPQGAPTSNITTLRLPGNRLTSLAGLQFACFPRLEELDLQQNQISDLDRTAFRGLPVLRVLSLQGNRLTRLGWDWFTGLWRLEVLLLGDNPLQRLEEGVFRDLAELRELSLGQLDYVYELHLNLLFYGFPRKIRRLAIDAGEGTYLGVGDAPGPDAPFDLELRGNKLMFEECPSPVWAAVRALRVGDGQMICCDQFMAPYFAGAESLEYRANPEHLFTDYSGLHHLHALRRLKLTDLNFHNQSDLSLLFRNLTNLRSLQLLNCRLSFLPAAMFRDLHSLRLLRLYSQSPLVLLEGLFLPLLSLHLLFFDRLDFRCECSNMWLLDWAAAAPGVQVVHLEQQHCVRRYSRLDFVSSMERLCQTDAEFHCFLSTASCVGTLLVGALGYRLARWHMLALFFWARGRLERKLGGRRRRRRRLQRREDEQEEEEEEEREWQFDAFVSYSSRNEAWVVREMLPRLEGPGPGPALPALPLRLCLHSRDFEVGKGIVDNITDCVNASRCTVCVLSRAYLRSYWCSLELRLATYRLLAEQPSTLVLIFLEDIAPSELSAYHRLAKMVQKRMYLDWPEDEGERVAFWETLRRKIGGQEEEEEEEEEGEKEGGATQPGQ
ncbi:toll-like receptor 12 [Amia ocellicauda]|uniref:toll-like receptor 12 n=1 Tax=Amia ocellicauda TaxID=2972642 RepID=UPI003463D8CB